MTQEQNNHPLLDEYVLSEYRFQDERTEQLYVRASWQVGICALIGGSAYTVQRSDVLSIWTTNCLAFAYTLTGALLIALLIAIVVFIAIAIVPGRYAVPGATIGWLDYANQQTDADSKLLKEISEVADKNRHENRRRFKWLNLASKALALAAVLAAIHLLMVLFLSLSL